MLLLLPLVVDAGRRRGSERVGAVEVVAEVDVDMVVMAGVEVEVEHVLVARKAGPWLRRIHGACLFGGGGDGRRVGGDGTGCLERKSSFCENERGCSV